MVAHLGFDNARSGAASSVSAARTQAQREPGLLLLGYSDHRWGPAGALSCLDGPSRNSSCGYGEPYHDGLDNNLLHMCIVFDVAFLIPMISECVSTTIAET